LASPSDQFPRTVHVVVALIVSFAVLAVMVFWTGPYLRRISGGLELFDARYFGYTVEEARALLRALSEIGRAYYADVQLQIDTAFPALYALSRVLLLLWLTQPGRTADKPVPLPLRIAFLVPPIVTAWCDYFENDAIAAMLTVGPNVGADLVARASFWTQAKWLGVLVTETTCVILLAIAFVRWRQRRLPS
jgi:hypothetical protein